MDLSQHIANIDNQLSNRNESTNEMSKKRSSLDESWSYNDDTTQGRCNQPVMSESRTLNMLSAEVIRNGESSESFEDLTVKQSNSLGLPKESFGGNHSDTNVLIQSRNNVQIGVPESKNNFELQLESKPIKSILIDRKKASDSFLTSIESRSNSLTMNDDNVDTIRSSRQKSISFKEDNEVKRFSESGTYKKNRKLTKDNDGSVQLFSYPDLSDEDLGYDVADRASKQQNERKSSLNELSERSRARKRLETESPYEDFNFEKLTEDFQVEKTERNSKQITLMDDESRDPENLSRFSQLQKSEKIDIPSKKETLKQNMQLETPERNSKQEILLDESSYEKFDMYSQSERPITDCEAENQERNSKEENMEEESQSEKEDMYSKTDRIKIDSEAENRERNSKEEIMLDESQCEKSDRSSKIEKTKTVPESENLENKSTDETLLDESPFVTSDGYSKREKAKTDTGSEKSERNSKEETLLDESQSDKSDRNSKTEKITSDAELKSSYFLSELYKLNKEEIREKTDDKQVGQILTIELNEDDSDQTITSQKSKTENTASQTSSKEKGETSEIKMGDSKNDRKSKSKKSESKASSSKELLSKSGSDSSLKESKNSITTIVSDVIEEKPLQTFNISKTAAVVNNVTKITGLIRMNQPDSENSVQNGRGRASSPKVLRGRGERGRGIERGRGQPFERGMATNRRPVPRGGTPTRGLNVNKNSNICGRDNFYNRRQLRTIMRWKGKMLGRGRVETGRGVVRGRDPPLYERGAVNIRTPVLNVIRLLRNKDANINAADSGNDNSQKETSNDNEQSASDNNQVITNDLGNEGTHSFSQLNASENVFHNDKKGNERLSINDPYNKISERIEPNNDITSISIKEFVVQSSISFEENENALRTTLTEFGIGSNKPGDEEPSNKREIRRDGENCVTGSKSDHPIDKPSNTDLNKINAGKIQNGSKFYKQNSKHDNRGMNSKQNIDDVKRGRIEPEISNFVNTAGSFVEGEQEIRSTIANDREKRNTERDNRRVSFKNMAINDEIETECNWFICRGELGQDGKNDNFEIRPKRLSISGGNNHIVELDEQSWSFLDSDSSRHDNINTRDGGVSESGRIDRQDMERNEFEREPKRVTIQRVGSPYEEEYEQEGSLSGRDVSQISEDKTRGRGKFGKLESVYFKVRDDKNYKVQSSSGLLVEERNRGRSAIVIGRDTCNQYEYLESSGESSYVAGFIDTNFPNYSIDMENKKMGKSAVVNDVIQEDIDKPITFKEFKKSVPKGTRGKKDDLHFSIDETDTYHQQTSTQPSWKNSKDMKNDLILNARRIKENPNYLENKVEKLRDTLTYSGIRNSKYVVNYIPRGNHGTGLRDCQSDSHTEYSELENEDSEISGDKSHGNKKEKKDNLEVINSDTSALVQSDSLISEMMNDKSESDIPPITEEVMRTESGNHYYSKENIEPFEHEKYQHYVKSSINENHISPNSSAIKSVNLIDEEREHSSNAASSCSNSNGEEREHGRNTAGKDSSPYIEERESGRSIVTRGSSPYKEERERGRGEVLKYVGPHAEEARKVRSVVVIESSPFNDGMERGSSTTTNDSSPNDHERGRGRSVVTRKCERSIVGRDNSNYIEGRESGRCFVIKDSASNDTEREWSRGAVAGHNNSYFEEGERERGTFARNSSPYSEDVERSRSKVTRDSNPFIEEVKRGRNIIASNSIPYDEERDCERIKIPRGSSLYKGKSGHKKSEAARDVGSYKKESVRIRSTVAINNTPFNQERTRGRSKDDRESIPYEEESEYGKGTVSRDSSPYTEERESRRNTISSDARPNFEEIRSERSLVPRERSPFIDGRERGRDTGTRDGYPNKRERDHGRMTIVRDNSPFVEERGREKSTVANKIHDERVNEGEERQIEHDSRKMTCVDENGYIVDQLESDLRNASIKLLNSVKNVRSLKNSKEALEEDLYPFNLGESSRHVSVTGNGNTYKESFMPQYSFGAYMVTEIMRTESGNHFHSKGNIVPIEDDEYRLIISKDDEIRIKPNNFVMRNEEPSDMRVDVVKSESFMDVDENGKPTLISRSGHLIYEQRIDNFDNHSELNKTRTQIMNKVLDGQCFDKDASLYGKGTNISDTKENKSMNGASENSVTQKSIVMTDTGEIVIGREVGTVISGNDLQQNKVKLLSNYLDPFLVYQVTEDNVISLPEDVQNKSNRDRKESKIGVSVMNTKSKLLQPMNEYIQKHSLKTRQEFYNKFYKYDILTDQSSSRESKNMYGRNSQGQTFRLSHTAATLGKERSTESEEDDVEESTEKYTDTAVKETNQLTEHERSMLQKGNVNVMNGKQKEAFTGRNTTGDTINSDGGYSEKAKGHLKTNGEDQESFYEKDSVYDKLSDIARGHIKSEDQSYLKGGSAKSAKLQPGENDDHRSIYENHSARGKQNDTERGPIRTVGQRAYGTSSALKGKSQFRENGNDRKSVYYESDKASDSLAKGIDIERGRVRTFDKSGYGGSSIGNGKQHYKENERNKRSVYYDSDSISDFGETRSDIDRQRIRADDHNDYDSSNWKDKIEIGADGAVQRSVNKTTTSCNISGKRSEIEKGVIRAIDQREYIGRNTEKGKMHIEENDKLHRSMYGGFESGRMKTVDQSGYGYHRRVPSVKEFEEIGELSNDADYEKRISLHEDLNYEKSFMHVKSKCIKGVCSDNIRDRGAGTSLHGKTCSKCDKRLVKSMKRSGGSREFIIKGRNEIIVVDRERQITNDSIGPAQEIRGTRNGEFITIWNRDEDFAMKYTGKRDTLKETLPDDVVRVTITSQLGSENSNNDFEIVDSGQLVCPYGMGVQKTDSGRKICTFDAEYDFSTEIGDISPERNESGNDIQKKTKESGFTNRAGERVHVGIHDKSNGSFKHSRFFEKDINEKSSYKNIQQKKNIDFNNWQTSPEREKSQFSSTAGKHNEVCSFLKCMNRIYSDGNREMKSFYIAHKRRDAEDIRDGRKPKNYLYENKSSCGGAFKEKFKEKTNVPADIDETTGTFYNDDKGGKMRYYGAHGIVTAENIQIERKPKTLVYENRSTFPSVRKESNKDEVSLDRNRTFSNTNKIEEKEISKYQKTSRMSRVETSALLHSQIEDAIIRSTVKELNSRLSDIISATESESSNKPHSSYKPNSSGSLHLNVVSEESLPTLDL